MAQVIPFSEYERQVQRAVAANEGADAIAPGNPVPEPPIPMRPANEGAATAAPTSAPAASTVPWWVGTAFDPNGPGAAAASVPVALPDVLAQLGSWLPLILLAVVVYIGWRFWHRRGGLAHV